MRANLNPYLLGYENMPFETLVEQAKRCGFGAVEFPSWDIHTVEEGRRAGETLREAGLEWGLVPMPFDFYQGADEEFEAGLKQLDTLLPVAQAAGVKLAYNHIWPGSDRFAWDDNLEWHRERIGRVLERNLAYGIHYGLEILGPRTLMRSFQYPFINSYAEGVPFVKSISPHLGFVVDTYHWFTSGSSLEDLRAIGDGGKIVNFHVNDAWKGRTLEEHGDMERELPLATGVIDAVAVAEVVAEMGYTGIVTCEPFEPAVSRIQAMPMGQGLQLVADSVKGLLERANIPFETA